MLFRSRKSQNWYGEGIRFECQGSGKCCVSRGQYGYVYLNKKDRQRMAKVLGVSTQFFTRNFCSKTEGFFHLREDKSSKNCLFLKKNQCSVYEGRPTQCRTWPFWPELMNAKSWKKDVVGFCPGVGKGRLYKPEEIKKIVSEQTHSEQTMS